MNEAPPVVTGRADDRTAFSVFKGWQASPEFQAKFNPWVEMLKAKELRDAIVLKFRLRGAAEMVGQSLSERCQLARAQLSNNLRQRGWSSRMIDAYFG